MFYNDLKIALRNLWRNKTFSIINILGLSVGITCVILILLWVLDEFSYDKFHKNSNEIFRVVQVDPAGKNSRTPALFAPELSPVIPEIESYTRVFKTPRLVFKQGSNVFHENNGIIVDPEFLSMFNFTFVKGNPNTALLEPSNIIITESLAQKYFGNNDPIDKLLIIDGKNESVVKGVIKDVPANSHLQFDFILPFCLMKLIMPNDITNWGAFNYTTYLQLAPDADVALTTEKINKIVKDKIPPQVLHFWDKFELQPLAQCHLSSDISNDHFLGNFTTVEDRNTVFIFLCIAFLILFLACINFMNLSIAQSRERTMEIGLKKVMGSTRSQFKKQFLSEFFFLSLTAMGLAIVLAKLALPYFNQISGKELVIDHFSNLVIYLAILLLATLLGGSYPALRLSSFNPISLLRGEFHTGYKSNNTRSALVIFQFAISIILIAGTFIVHRQMKHIQNKKLGFVKENIVYIPIGRYNTLKKELLKNPNIQTITAKDCLPTTTMKNLVDFYWNEKASDQEVLMEYAGIDYQYFETLNIEVANGRDFSKDFSSDASNAFILNEEAVKHIGLESPIGKKFASNNKSGTIVGVIKNINFKTLHQKPNPQVYHVMKDVQNEASYTGVMLIKLNGAGQDKTIKFIKETWEKLCPDIPYEYHFLDQTYDQLYASEQKVKTIINYFSFLAILIACLGLYGLVIITTAWRTKEIGIRKVNGAKVSEILTLLNKDFIIWVAIAFVIACPVVWYAMDKWLENFAYKTSLSWWVFALAGLLALSIALLTVSWQSWRAATRNPVEALRYE